MIKVNLEEKIDTQVDMNRFLNALMYSGIKLFDKTFIISVIDIIIRLDNVSDEIKQKYFELYIERTDDENEARKIFNYIYSLNPNIKQKLAKFFIKSFFNKNKYAVMKLDTSSAFVNWVYLLDY